jgi:elongation factor G
MIEAAVEMDDDAMEAYLEGEEPDVPNLRALIRKGTLAMHFVPVLGGSAFKNKGVQPLLNAVIDYLPSPLDVVDYMGFPRRRDRTRNIPRRADDDMPFAGLAFKIMNDPFVGSLTFTRIYSGKMNKGDTILNSTKGKKERIGRMMMMHSNNREEIEEAFAGDIIALAGLKDTTTGDTLCDAQRAGGAGNDDLPRSGDRDRGRAQDQGRPGEDVPGSAASGGRRPVLPRRDRPRIGQTIMKGMGELHLDILVDRLKREFKVEANIGAPQVAYRETIGHEVEHTYTHKKQSGGSGQFAEVKLDHLPHRAGRRLFVRKPHRGWCRAEGIHPRRRKGHQVGHG